MNRLALILLLLALPIQSIARDGGDRGPVRRPTLDIANPQIENFVHSAGNLCLNVTNFGILGGEESWGDPCAPADRGYGEFPCGSGYYYLFHAAGWLGAEILEEDTIFARVSVGMDGWAQDIYELYPGEGESNEMSLRSNIPGALNCLGEEIFHPQADANQEFVGVYSDTLTDAFWVVDDPIDGDHLPLGIEVTQVSRQWSAPDFADFVIFEFRLRNIGTRELRNPYFGVYVDGDVYEYGTLQGHVDDLSGYLFTDPVSGDTVNIAYIADNDARPPEQFSGPLIYPHVAGLTILGGVPEDAKVSYNWWVSNGDELLDFGPDWEGDPIGTPMGDARKYGEMSNGQIDYDQVHAGSNNPPQLFRDPCNGEETVHPWPLCDIPGNCADLANGYDARYLYSIGPVGIFDHFDGQGRCVYRLNPGEEVTLTFGYLIGRDFHDANNPQINPNQIDPSLFDFTGLMETYRAASLLYETGYTFQPPVPPADLHPIEPRDGEVPLAWQPPAIGTISGYNIFREDNSGNRTLLTPFPVQDLQFLATGLVNGHDWKFQAQTVDDSDYVSAIADTLVRVGAPLPVTGLRGTVLGSTISLVWDACSDPLFTDYRIRRYSSIGDSVDFTATSNSFSDDGLVSGRQYTYHVFARNSRLLENLPGQTVTLTAWNPQRRILVIDETEDSPTPERARFGGIADSLVDELYWRVLSDLGEPFDTLEQYSNGPLRFSGELLSQYDLVIWHSADLMDASNFDFLVQRETTLAEYVRTGGRLFRDGRRLLNGSLFHSGCPGYPGNLPFGLLEPMEIDSYCVPGNRFPPLSDFMQITGGSSAVAGFANFAFDTAKVMALNWGNPPQHIPYLPYVDVIWPGAPTRALYRSIVLPTDTSGLANQPVAAIDQGQIVLLFPLYFMYEQDAQALLSACIDTLRAQTDVPPPPDQPIAVESPVLYPNFPNPFNPSTEIRFALPKQAQVKLAIFNTLGQQTSLLADRVYPAGDHTLQWSGTNSAGLSVSSGVYFVQLQSGDFVQTRKMILLR